jgi:predicted acetyltransferase
MLASSLSISNIGPESEVILRNLFEHYLHDMSEWFELDTEPDGSYAYDMSSIWSNGHSAYLAKVGDSIAGFAIVSSPASLPQDIAEFFVLRKFRRAGVGRQMAAFLWNERSGEWLVRVAEANTPAIPFWRKSISTYSHGSYTEETRISNGRPWRFFRFVSTGA